MINLNPITSNSKTIKSHYTQVMSFAKYNLLLYGKLESSYQYVVQVVMDMFDKYEQFLEVSLCQYTLHMNNILCKFLLLLGLLTLLYLGFFPGKYLPVNLCNVSSGWICFLFNSGDNCKVRTIISWINFIKVKSFNPCVFTNTLCTLD